MENEPLSNSAIHYYLLFNIEIALLQISDKNLMVVEKPALKMLHDCGFMWHSSAK